MRFYFKVPICDIDKVKSLGAKYHKRYDMWVCYVYNKHLFRKFNPIKCTVYDLMEDCVFEWYNRNGILAN